MNIFCLIIGLLITVTTHSMEEIHRKCDHQLYQKYSQEEPCAQCEVKQHPEKFVACLLCRIPVSRAKIFNPKARGEVCLNCTEALNQVLVEKLKVKNHVSHENALGVGLGSYLTNHAKRLYAKTYINDFADQKIYNEVFKSKNVLPIYLGTKYLEKRQCVHIWSTELAIAPDDKKLIFCSDEAVKHMEYIFDKYNIFGAETWHSIEHDLSGNIVTYLEK